MKTELLKKLRSSCGFVSGQQLCDEFKVSRTAVWKYINQLKEEGYEIEAVNNKGYRIISYPDIVTDTEIESRLDSNDYVKKVIYYEETDSTNNQAKLLADKVIGSKDADGLDGTLFVTERQNSGRGRRGKQWISPKGSGVWMTLLLRPKIEPQYASMITIVAAVAIAEAVSKAANISCGIKWPNDLVINKKKVTGILTEMSTEIEQINYVIVGIGVNVNTEHFDASISSMASSLFIETGRHVKRSDIIIEFSRAFNRYYSMFLETKDLSNLRQIYDNMLVNKDKQVKIIEKDTEITATALGINDRGELIIRLEDGSLKEVVSGEVSVRGLYGYV